MGSRDLAGCWIPAATSRSVLGVRLSGFSLRLALRLMGKGCGKGSLTGSRRGMAGHTQRRHWSWEKAAPVSWWPLYFILWIFSNTHKSGENGAMLPQVHMAHLPLLSPCDKPSWFI